MHFAISLATNSGDFGHIAYIHAWTVIGPDNLRVFKNVEKQNRNARTMKIENQLLSTILLLSYLPFASCSDKKADTSNKETNPFGSVSDTETKILHPCRWTFSVGQSGNGEAVLLSTAKLDSGWHLYSQHIPGKGPSTEFTYDSLHKYNLIGETEEGESIKKYDPNLEMEVLYFEREAVFKQKIKVVSKIDFTITGAIDYMVCLDQGQCSHFDEEISFTVKGNPSITN